MANEVVNLLNRQISLEFSSAYLYLEFSAKLSGLALPGAAHWYRLQAREEIRHGLRIFDYLVRIGEIPQLFSVEAPQNKAQSLEETAEAALTHEKFISRSIDAIYAQALKESDVKAQSFLTWFIDEQLEEEDAARTVLDEVKRIGSCKAGLVLLDREMGEREG